MTAWRPQLDISQANGSLQAKLLDALARDIGSGVLRPGTRLPPQRDLAYRLGISLGTVTKAYAEAERRGLVTAHVGRGSFVADAAASQSPGASSLLDLRANLPPLGAATAARLAEALARLRRRRDLAELLAYPPPLGLERHRRAAARWLAPLGLAVVDWQDLVITMGAQHALALVFAVLVKPGDTILTEAASFHNVKPLAQRAGYRLQGLALDEEGLRPDALDRAARPGAVLYTMPTLQNPTARTMSRARREAIAAIARHHELWIVEDDVYGALAEAGPPPLATLAPERTWYVTSFSKTVAPGLRTGFLVAPRGASQRRDAIAQAIEASLIAPPGFGPALAAEWLEDGTAAEIVAETRREARARQELARAVLGIPRLAPESGAALHLWLDLPEIEAERVAGRALRAGVFVTPPAAPVIESAAISGLRICLGAAPGRDALRRALEVIAAALTAAGEDRLVL